MDIRKLTKEMHLLKHDIEINLFVKKSVAILVAATGLVLCLAGILALASGVGSCLALPFIAMGKSLLGTATAAACGHLAVTAVGAGLAFGGSYKACQFFGFRSLQARKLAVLADSLAPPPPGPLV